MSITTSDEAMTRDLEQRIDTIVERFNQMNMGYVDELDEPEHDHPTIDPFSYIYSLRDKLKTNDVFVCRRSTICKCKKDCECDDDDYAVAKDWKLHEVGGTKMQLTCMVDKVMRCDKKNDLRFFTLDTGEEFDQEVVLFDVTWSKYQMTVDTVGFAMEDAPSYQLGTLLIAFDVMQYSSE